MHWRLIAEEYAPELIYIKGEHNIVADALSRLNLEPGSHMEQMHDMHYLLDHFGLEDNDLPDDSFPLTYKLLAKHQRTDTALLEKAHKSSMNYQLKTFHGVAQNVNCYV